jgi:short-subunit dehydrogenase
MSSAYVASKFAMEGYSDSLRRELGDHGVSVSVVEPGFVQSSIFATNEAAIASMMEEDDRSEKTLQTYPKLYSEASAAKRRSNIAHASSPVDTSDAILHAVSAPFPQTRYAVATVGKMSAKVATMLVSVLPDRVVDVLM